MSTENMSSSTNEESTAIMQKLKYMSLLTLTFRNAILAVSMRYSRTRSGDMFFEGTAVLMAEVIKLLPCMFLVYRSPEEGAENFKKFSEILHKTIILNKL